VIAILTACHFMMSISTKINSFSSNFYDDPTVVYAVDHRNTISARVLFGECQKMPALVSADGGHFERMM